jgi:alanine racemase
MRLPIYLKLNSGMNRLGITAAQLPAVRRELEAFAGTRPADSDDPLR